MVLYHPDLVFLLAQSKEKAELQIAPGTVMKYLSDNFKEKVKTRFTCLANSNS